MVMRNENYTNEVAGGVDRITQILQQNARPVNPLQSQGLNIPPNILNAMLSGSLSGGRPVFEQAMDYQQGIAKDQGDILTAYENKLKMGDRMTKSLDDKIQMFVGSDPQAKATILQELHALPEDVDPTNSKTYATIAGIAKKHGLVNLDRELELQKLARGGGSTPVGIQYADELERARKEGNGQRVKDILLTIKALEKGQTVNEKGEVVPIPGAIESTQKASTAKSFGEAVGKKTGEALTEKRDSASKASDTLKSNEVARNLLDSGIITGAGANYLLAFGKALNQMGISYAEDEIANTEAFVAQRALEVGRLITMFGAGTGLSDADREFATKAAAGQINLNEESLRRILRISDDVSKETINKYNAELEKAPKEGMPYDLSVSDTGTKKKRISFEDFMKE